MGYLKGEIYTLKSKVDKYVYAGGDIFGVLDMLGVFYARCVVIALSDISESPAGSR